MKFTIYFFLFRNSLSNKGVRKYLLQHSAHDSILTFSPTDSAHPQYYICQHFSPFISMRLFSYTYSMVRLVCHLPSWYPLCIPYVKAYVFNLDTLTFALCVLQVYGFDKCIMSNICHYSILYNSFTFLRKKSSVLQ